jgi:hypothetical protein
LCYYLHSCSCDNSTDDRILFISSSEESLKKLAALRKYSLSNNNGWVEYGIAQRKGTKRNRCRCNCHAEKKNPPEEYIPLPHPPLAVINNGLFEGEETKEFKMVNKFWQEMANRWSVLNPEQKKALIAQFNVLDTFSSHSIQ